MTVQEFGALLRERREARGFTIEELAGRIKLSARTLQAIENGSMEGLPHAVYARGFVRSYAQQVGLDQEEIVEGLDIMFPLSSIKDDHPLPGPIGRHRTTGGRSFGDKFVAALLVLLLLILPVGAGWFVFTHYGDTIVEWAKRPFTATSTENRTEGSGALDAGNIAANAANAENSVPVSPNEGNVALDSNMIGGADGPGAEDGSAQALPSAEAAAEGADALPSSEQQSASNEQAQQIPPTRPGEQTVQIFAQQKCWVEVRADAARARSFELAPGESSFLTFKDRLDLTLGNASGVTLHYNGQVFPMDGKRIRNLSFPPQ